jgi:LmbE family N-acetylglucosaminyl deacetylase
MNRSIAAVILFLLALVAMPELPRAQMPPISRSQGQVGLGVLIRQLKTTGVVMYATAHPDDENNAVLAKLGWGDGHRTIVATATRGNGGQNEIGPELFEALAALRTEELHAAQQLDSHEQYFGRAIDFGYSFSTDETFEKWGRREILGDFVRLLRILRPDVILGMRPDGTGGGQHHQASAILIREAMAAAGDPAQFPEQIKEGLRPWQAKKLYYTGRYGFPGEPAPPASVKIVPVATSAFDPLVGMTWAELGSRARSNHKTQGMAQLLTTPGPSAAGYVLAESPMPGQKAKTETSLFDGIDTTLPGLAALAASEPPAALTAGLEALADQVSAAERALASGGTEAAAAPLAAALSALRALRGQLAGMTLEDTARVSIDQRLAYKEQQFVDALLMAASVRIDATADDGVVHPGQPVKVSVFVSNSGAAAVALKQVDFRGFDGDAGQCRTGRLDAGAVSRCDATLAISKQARLSTPYWSPVPGAARYTFESDVPFGVPFRPTPFRVSVDLEVAGAPVTIARNVEHRYEGNIFSGEKRMELQVVPRLAVTVSPGIAIVPARAAQAARRAARGREFRVTVVNGTKGPIEGDVTLEAPAGWTVTPRTAHANLAREDEADPLRFTVTPPSGAKPGEYRVRTFVTAGGATYDQGYQVIEYPHTRRRHLVHAAEATLKVVDVAIAPALSVGYVMGVGDQVPAAIEQLGAKVTLLEADTLAWGDLSAFDVIVTGVRAYERREDLRAHNHRLLEYAQRGGTLVVQYNKFEFNQAQYGPFPAKVSATRVTDEHAPTTILAPTHPVFTWPNAIGASAWDGWVQERGLYFLGEKDAKYVDLLELTEPFPFNAGAKRGALVEARVGKGRWIYVGLGLWRQLPAGTDGAYQLLANILSVGTAPQPAARPAR